LPIEKIPSYAVVLHSSTLTTAELARRFRLAEVPVFGYLREEHLWLDARTIRDEEIAIVGKVARGISGR
jgi:seryl-tRNA(Sec) selenium transferase